MNKPFREELDAFETKSFIYNYEVDSFGKVEKIIEQEYHKSRDALVERVANIEKEYDLAMGHLNEAIKAIDNPLIQNDIYNLSGMEEWVVKQDLLNPITKEAK